MNPDAKDWREETLLEIRGEAVSLEPQQLGPTLTLLRPPDPAVESCNLLIGAHTSRFVHISKIQVW